MKYLFCAFLLLLSQNTVFAQVETRQVNISISGTMLLLASHFDPRELNEQIPGLELQSASPAQIIEASKALKIPKSSPAVLVAYSYQITDSDGGAEAGLEWQLAIRDLKNPEALIQSLNNLQGELKAFGEAKVKAYQEKLSNQ